jgi:hypothetical protein
VNNFQINIPPLIQKNIQKDCLHIFLIHNPVAVIMTTIMVDAYRIPLNNVRVIGIRNANAQMTGFRELHLNVCKYDRYVNRIIGRNMAMWRLRRKIQKSCSNYIVYAAWMYPEVEELVYSHQNLGHVIFEEGQQSYYQSLPYRHSFFNNWIFRRGKILRGSIAHYFRDDASAFVGLTPKSFPLMPKDKCFVLPNLGSMARNYTPQLRGILAIGLMPAPRRLEASDFFSAIDELISHMEGHGVIKMHPGFLSEKLYIPEHFAQYISERSGGRISLCPDDVLLEMEMCVEKKQLYGARSSLSYYAELMGSSYTLVNFKNYIAPII